MSDRSIEATSMLAPCRPQFSALDLGLIFYFSKKMNAARILSCRSNGIWIGPSWREEENSSSLPLSSLSKIWSHQIMGRGGCREKRQRVLRWDEVVRKKHSKEPHTCTNRTPFYFITQNPNSHPIPCLNQKRIRSNLIIIWSVEIIRRKGRWVVISGKAENQKPHTLFPLLTLLHKTRCSMP